MDWDEAGLIFFTALCALAVAGLVSLCFYLLIIAFGWFPVAAWTVGVVLFFAGGTAFTKWIGSRR
jgi:CHASE2 domain-containing sensor protein